MRNKNLHLFLIIVVETVLIENTNLKCIANWISIQS